MKGQRYLTNCSKCGKEFLREPYESITCPECRDKIKTEGGKECLEYVFSVD